MSRIFDDPPSTPPGTNPGEFEPPDALKAAWVDFGAHSNYPSEIAMKQWIRVMSGEIDANA